MNSEHQLKKEVTLIYGQGKRSYQQDSYAYGNNYFLVADGVGGNDDGDKASRLVADKLKDFSSSYQGAFTPDLLIDWIERCWGGVDQLSPESHSKPATTLAGVWMTGPDQYLAVHIGDSRVYHFRPDAITQILYRSRDDTRTDALLLEGSISPIEALRHPIRSSIQRAILGGRRYPVAVEEGASLEVGDYLLVCSDGLIENLTDEMLRFIFAPYRTAEEVTTLLNQHMCLTNDNHTALIIHFEQAPESSLVDELSQWQDFNPSERSLHAPSPLDEGFPI